MSTLQREIDRMPAAASNERLARLNIPPHLLYFSGGWETGTMLTSGPATSAALSPQRLRYNIVLQRLEVLDNGQDGGFQVFKPVSTPGFSFRTTSGNSYQFLAKSYYTENHLRQQAFFEVLTQGPVQLLILHEFYIQPAEIVQTFNVERKPEEYRRSTRLFASGPATGEATELDLVKQAVLKLFEKTERTTLSAYAAEHHLAYTDINDVVNLVRYYNAQHPAGKQ